MEIWHNDDLPGCYHDSRASACLLLTGAVPVRSAQFGSGFGIIHLDNVQCDGSELRLANCTHLGVGNHNCLLSEDAGVICSAGY